MTELRADELCNVHCIATLFLSSSPAVPTLATLEEKLPKVRNHIKIFKTTAEASHGC